MVELFFEESIKRHKERVFIPFRYLSLNLIPTSVEVDWDSLMRHPPLILSRGIFVVTSIGTTIHGENTTQEVRDGMLNCKMSHQHAFENT